MLRDLVALRLECLRVDRPEDDGLGEVGGADGDRRAGHGLRTGFSRRGFRTRARAEQQQPEHRRSEEFAHAASLVAGNRSSYTTVAAASALERRRTPAGSTTRSSKPKPTSVATANNATSSAPAKTCGMSNWDRPSMMKRPRPPQPTTAPSGTVAT